MVQSFELSMNTNGNMDVVNITRQVEQVVQESEISNGIVTIFCPSATSSVTTIEYEEGCIKDLQKLYDEIINEDRHYAHNARWGDGNGHSHIRAALTGPSLTVPVVSKSLVLGTWQQIIFIDFDNRPRKRKLLVQLLGE